MSSYWHVPQFGSHYVPTPPGTSGLPPSPYHQYGQPFQGQPNWQGGPPPWLGALLAARQNSAAYQAPIAPPINNTGAALPPGLVGNTHVPFLQPGGSGYPGNYGGGQGFGNPTPTGIFPTQGFGHPMPPTVGRVGV